MRLRHLLILIFLAAPLAAQNAFVTGVVQTEGGERLRDMTVAAYTLSGDLASTTATDGQGRYLLALAPATYRILAYDNRGQYATNYYSNARSFESSAQITLAPGQQLADVNFLLVLGFKVSGRVDSSQLGALANAVVAAYNLDGSRRGFTKTNSTGLYTLVLPPGDYKFVAWDENFAANTVHAPEFYLEEATFDQAATVSVLSDKQGINFTLAAGAKVSGRVTDRKTAARIPAVIVGAYDFDGRLRYSTPTDSNGEFIFALPEGTFKLIAADPQGKYAVSYYLNAPNFASAAAITIVRGQTVGDVQFSLVETEEQTPFVMFVAGVANTPGVGETFFQTDLWIQNPSSSAAVDLTVTYLLAERDNSQRQGVNVTIGPRQQLYYTNVLQKLFNATGTGALKLEGTKPFRVTSRTYNNPPNAPQSGTFGLAIPGERIGDSLGRALISGLANNASYRSNVGVLNPHPREINVNYALFRSDGQPLAAATRTFLPLEWFQVNLFTYLNVGTEMENVYLILTSPDGSFFAYGSIVDQKSGDGTFVKAVAD